MLRANFIKSAVIGWRLMTYCEAGNRRFRHVPKLNIRVLSRTYFLTAWKQIALRMTEQTKNEEKQHRHRCDGLPITTFRLCSC